MTFMTSPGGFSAAGRAFGPIITYPALRHTASVIMLHGLGDTGNGWAPVASELNLPHIKWIFPTAPTRPISVNMQMSMPGWFDIDHLDVGAFQGMMRGQRQGFDPDGVAESVEYVKTLVQKEIVNGIPASRIVVGGFSQGGHIALKTALPAKDRLAGCLALSTWMEAAQMDIPPVNLDMPIFMGHGSSDPLIPLLVANATLDVLQKTKGCRNVDFKVYPGMQHSACPQEFQDVRKFLLEVLPEQEASAPSKEDVAAMSAKQLKDFLASRGVSAAGLLEKRELVEKALSLL